MTMFAIMVALLVFTLLKPQPTSQYEHPLIGRVVTVEYGYAKASSYSSTSPTGKVVSITDGWVTIELLGSDHLITIPTSRVHDIRTQD